MTNQFYKYGLNDRRRMLADEGFSRDDSRIWTHSDGRSLGEGVAIALTDLAFFNYLGLEPPEEDLLTSAETADLLEPEIQQY